jgi:hypothetical protein
MCPAEWDGGNVLLGGDVASRLFIAANLGM